MCGRFYLDADFEEVLRSMFGSGGGSRDFAYGEQRPGTLVGVLSGGKDPQPQRAHWGWTVPWSKSLLINARSETVLHKPVFSSEWETGRCVLPATGYYEAFGSKGKRIAVSCGGPLFYMAGLLRVEPSRTAAALVILTKNAVAPVASFHDRMPVVFSWPMAKEYLDWTGSGDALQQWLAQCPPAAMTVGSDFGIPLLID